ncbi:MAG TPA: D-alanyl-D-alanine carboxypeptidase family protein [Candidatus Methylomirabilis sp.]|nr:D-alanyl-D-alanine carboxypeptidase family protein [Candidatus Methylomirabilis sp.]
MRAWLGIGLALTLVAAVPAWAQNHSGRALPLSAEAVLLLDAQGKVLYAKNAAEEHAPASLVKLMTLYLACEAIESGRAQWDEPVVISERAAQTPRYRMGLRTGDTVPLRTLLEGVAIASANDAATAVAEHLGGTEEAFVAQMNVRARDLELSSTHFANAHGLPDPGGRSTAEDLAKLTRRVIEDYPVSRALLGGAMFVYRGRVYSRNIPLFRDPGGVQALKTGFTRAAGYNLAVAAWRAQERFVLIVLGAQSRSLSYRDARALLSYGFQETGLQVPATETVHRRPSLPRRSVERRSRAVAPPIRIPPRSS